MSIYSYYYVQYLIHISLTPTPQVYAVLIMCQALHFLWNRGNVSQMEMDIKLLLAEQVWEGRKRTAERALEGDFQ